MTTPDSALNALSTSLTSVDSPLAANLADILTDAIQELIEAELSNRIGAEPNERSRISGSSSAINAVVMSAL